MSLYPRHIVRIPNLQKSYLQQLDSMTADALRVPRAEIHLDMTNREHTVQSADISEPAYSVRLDQLYSYLTLHVQGSEQVSLAKPFWEHRIFPLWPYLPRSLIMNSIIQRTCCQRKFLLLFDHWSSVFDAMLSSNSIHACNLYGRHCSFNLNLCQPLLPFPLSILLPVRFPLSFLGFGFHQVLTLHQLSATSCDDADFLDISLSWGSIHGVERLPLLSLYFLPVPDRGKSAVGSFVFSIKGVSREYRFRKGLDRALLLRRGEGATSARASSSSSSHISSDSVIPFLRRRVMLNRSLFFIVGVRVRKSLERIPWLRKDESSSLIRSTSSSAWVFRVLVSGSGSLSSSTKPIPGVSVF